MPSGKMTARAVLMSNPAPKADKRLMCFSLRARKKGTAPESREPRKMMMHMTKKFMSGFDRSLLMWSCSPAAARSASSSFQMRSSLQACPWSVLEVLPKAAPPRQQVQNC